MDSCLKCSSELDQASCKWIAYLRWGSRDIYHKNTKQRCYELKARLHGNLSRWSRAKIDVGRPRVYTETDGTVPNRTASRTRTGPPRR